MKIAKKIEEIPSSLKSPIALTIGTFDGLHLGHQHLLHNMRKHVKDTGTIVVLTFANHPLQVLKQQQSTAKLLNSIEQKIQLFQDLNVDLLILLEFSQELSLLSPEDFLKQIQTTLPFSHLILGTGAVFGKGKQGDEKTVKQLEKQLHFEAEYLPKLVLEGEPVSSGRIRNLIEKGDLEGAFLLLGRPFSLYLPLSINPKDFQKASINADNYCLPPPGHYEAKILCNEKSFLCTVSIDSNFKVNIDIPGCEENLSDVLAEIVFLKTLSKLEF